MARRWFTPNGSGRIRSPNTLIVAGGVQDFQCHFGIRLRFSYISILVAMAIFPLLDDRQSPLSCSDEVVSTVSSDQWDPACVPFLPSFLRYRLQCLP